MASNHTNPNPVHRGQSTTVARGQPPECQYNFCEENEVMDMAVDDKRDQLLLRCYHRENWFDIGVWETKNPVKKTRLSKELKEYETEDYVRRHGRHKGVWARVIRSENYYNFSSGDIGGQYRQICMDTKRDVIVATFHYKIVLINMDGKQVKKIKSSSKDCPFLDVEGIAYSESQDMYAATDLKQHCVMLISAQSYKTKMKFGGKPYLNVPYYVMFMSMEGTETLVVSDTGNHCIKILDMEGKILKLYGGEGVGDGELRIPLGICEGPEGSILVCDHDNQRVVRFWSHRGQDLNQVIVELEANRPRFVATTGVRKDQMFVCSLFPQLTPMSRNHIIQKFTGVDSASVHVQNQQ